MTLALQIAAGILLFLGFLLFVGGAVGVLRFPDFYTRMHAAGKGDTLSSLLLVTGLALHNLADFAWADLLTSVKLLLICAFILIASPTAAHAIIDAGYEKGLRPWKRKRAEPAAGGEEKP